MTIEIVPLHPLFAAEVRGADLTRDLDDATFAAIRAAFEEHSVVVFRDQDLTDEQQLAFSRRFGPLESTISSNSGSGTELVYISNLDRDGNILPVDGTYMRYLSANELWHSDSSFKPVPALASLLHGRIVPPEGADTQFASMRAAWDLLPEETRQLIDGRVAIHHFQHSRDKVAKGLVDAGTAKSLPPVRQAMVVTNPVNGRRAVYVGSHTAEVEGMATEAARRLVDGLVSAATAPERIYSHRWRRHDLVMWDNRAVLHRGTGYDKARFKRHMVRTTVAGTAPTVAAPLAA